MRRTILIIVISATLAFAADKPALTALKQSDKPVSQSTLPLTTQSISIAAKTMDYTVIEFPFEIKDVSRTSLMDGGWHGSNDLFVQDGAGGLDLSDFNEKGQPQQTPKKQQAQQQPKDVDSGYGYERGKNTITVFGKTNGTVSFIIWGYDYPIPFKVVFGKDGQSVYSFEDKPRNENSVKNIESSGHENAIQEITKSLALGDTPKGYKTELTPKEINMDGRLKLTLNKQIRGRLYLGQEWFIQNTTSKAIVLDEESFYQNGIFGVAVEENVLTPGQKSRLFLVRASKQ